ncbi:MAG: Ni/Fe-hydrogenase cytochrome b subunit [Candidatus Omnitrophica bacterium]|nr:Ni/Fe-hydrogenase cytochrome b subunit [Candidatus Omnitrophota bacterium]MCA9416239.1 Ni/Fe-hydrogenase cytochrome b subunit [Candidatus Omnitrophota bacterium]MCA9423721.1 Ni/Fe-hydrogenase cytochrome b subunit [Candidatus Omnitrophota bacterium]MCA9436877.1 Ni/Fe-hydrogenase cytochrome b subunit [Candidatus Omnitrophota bacterium]MCB9770843.1 Ni/Fe-hydrogenase cytochrome b subunit [Candidatus Omnitrophota bacterium]
MISNVAYEPVSKRLLTPGVFVLLGGLALAAFVAIYRVIFGLGETTNLDNQYPWGIWIAIDVATGVALAAGGFTTAALAYIFHQHRYEPIVRAALLTALLGYTFVALGLLVDLGRFYNIWHPMMPSMWQGNSALFEVGMCVMFYLTVLYIEFMPIVSERFKGKVALPGKLGGLNGLIESLLSLFDKTLGKVMFLFVIAGVVLSCMHQSSLGSLVLIAPSKIHPLWYTPILPLLFLLSAISVGLPMVIVESMSASKVFGRKPEMEVLEPLGRLALIPLGIYAIAKITDLLVRETYVYLFDGSVASWMFLIEIGFGVALPFVMLSIGSVRKRPPLLFLAALLVVLGVAVNRINVFLVAYHPPYADYSYFPSTMEILFTIGMAATLMLVYRVIVTVFPILPREEGSH